MNQSRRTKQKASQSPLDVLVSGNPHSHLILASNQTAQHLLSCPNRPQTWKNVLVPTPRPILAIQVEILYCYRLDRTQKRQIGQALTDPPNQMQQWLGRDILAFRHCKGLHRVLYANGLSQPRQSHPSRMMDQVGRLYE